MLRRAVFALLMALAAGAAVAQEPAPVPEAVQRELAAGAGVVRPCRGGVRGPAAEPLDHAVRRGRRAARGAWAPRRCPPRGKDLLAQAYEYRGRAYFGIGLSEKASESFRQLVQLKPDYVVSKERVSPKIVDLFNNVKKALVGYVAVSSQPAGAQATLVSPSGARTDLGLTDFFPVEVLAGEYTVEVAARRATARRRGRSASRPRPPRRVDVELVRVLASLFVVTEPAGVEVWVDGELRATTAGSLAPEHGRGGARPRRRPGARLGAHRGREPLARQPRRRAAAEVLRAGPAHGRHDAWPRTTRSSRSRWRTRSRRCASSPTRRGRASS